jgi:hypothetical protein
MIEIISYGDRLEKGNYKMHSRFNKAVNFISANTIASIVNEEIGAGPLNIVIRGSDLKDVRSLTIDDKGFLLNSSRFDFDDARRFDSRIEFVDIDIDKFEFNMYIFENCLLQYSSVMSLAFLLNEERRKNFRTSFERELVKRFEIGITKVFSSKLIEGIKMIKGAGFGFTPSGDDFLCGLLIALNIATRLFKLDLTEWINRIYNTARGNNPISNAFLRCAKEGLLFERFKKLVYSILYFGKKEIFECSQTLLSVGETSGADMGVGFLMGLKRCPLSAFSRQL